MPRDGSCAGCCVRNLDCESCQRCAPRYLCVNVDVTPGPYTDLSCCNVDEYGIGHFSFRMTYQCGTWSGVETYCTGIPSFGMTVSLNGSCNTVVTPSLAEESTTFEGILPAMSGTFSDELGNEYAWEVDTSNVVENPLAKDLCSPCSCATCLPRRLCFKLQSNGDGYTDPIDMAASLLFNCETRAWEAEGLPDGVTVAVALKPPEENVCGIDVAIDGDYGSFVGEILLEGPLNSRKYHGTICADSDEIESTIGVPELLPCPPEDPECEDPPPQEWVSFIELDISLREDPEGPVTGTATLRDQSCGLCEVDERCETPDPNPCCTNPPSLISLTETGSGSTATFRNLLVEEGLRIWGQISGTIPGQTTPWVIGCTDGNWAIGRFLDGPDVPLTLDACDPFQLSASGWVVTA